MQPKQTQIHIAIFFVIVFFISGCSQLSSWQKSPEPGTVLFDDDFSIESNTWGTMGRTGGQIGLEYGGLVITVDLSNFLFWTVQGEKFTDTVVDVDAVLLGGPVNDNFGVVCRYQDNENFYSFLVTHDGYYGIIKMMDGKMVLSTSDGKMQYSEDIRRGGGVNHIQATCNGQTLTLKVNDVLLAAVSDDTFTKGKVGLIAGAYAEPGVKVFFDNLLIRQP